LNSNSPVFFSIILQLILIYTPLGTLFKVVPLTINDWIIIIPLTFSGLVIFEGVKLIKK